MIGIYKIENKVNGKVYIGQSIDINTRWYNHRKELNGNRHHNEHLQREVVRIPLLLKVYIKIEEYDYSP